MLKKYANLSEEINRIKYLMIHSEGSTITESTLLLEGQNEDQTDLINIKTNKNRIFTKLNYTTETGKRIEINSENEYRPNIKKFGDFEFNTNLNIKIKLNNYWEFIMENNFKYTSYPATDIPEINYNGINKISYKFFW